MSSTLHPKTYASYPVVSTANSSGLFEVVVRHILAVPRSRCAGFACPACLAADTYPARPLLSTELILSPAAQLQPEPLFTPTPQAALRMLFDWLVTGHVLDRNPAPQCHRRCTTSPALTRGPARRALVSAAAELGKPANTYQPSPWCSAKPVLVKSGSVREDNMLKEFQQRAGSPSLT